MYIIPLGKISCELTNSSNLQLPEMSLSDDGNEFVLVLNVLKH